MRQRDLVRGLLVCATVVALDLASKAVVQAEVPRGDAVEVLPFLDIVNSRNDGVAFGLAGGVSPALIGVALVVLLGLVAYLGSKAHSGWAVWAPVISWNSTRRFLARAPFVLRGSTGWVSP